MPRCCKHMYHICHSRIVKCHVIKYKNEGKEKDLCQHSAVCSLYIENWIGLSGRLFSLTSTTQFTLWLSHWNENAAIAKMVPPLPAQVVIFKWLLFCCGLTALDGTCSRRIICKAYEHMHWMCNKCCVSLPRKSFWRPGAPHSEKAWLKGNMGIKESNI